MHHTHFHAEPQAGKGAVCFCCMNALWFRLPAYHAQIVQLTVVKLKSMRRSQRIPRGPCAQRYKWRFIYAPCLQNHFLKMRRPMVSSETVLGVQNGQAHDFPNAFSWF
eukprot:6468836-Amphidinium_carterae.1